MKKYFLDEKYRRFTYRVCTFPSIIAGIVGLIVGYDDQYYRDFDNYIAQAFWCVLFASVVLILYGTIRWVLKALPDE
ncbi:hypothetical protein JT359_16180 [Candidatus Poribacteria bacterium]|nr:hypothetical protein [Candidatus Poribacteria bacterium]